MEWVFSTCRGRPAQPERTKIAAAQRHLLRMGASYQADFAPMQTPRRIRSFVLRAGRTTPAQERALGELWPIYGIDTGEATLDLAAVFGRIAPRCVEIGFGAWEVIEPGREQSAYRLSRHRGTPRGRGQALASRKTQPIEKLEAHLPRRRGSPARSNRGSESGRSTGILSGPLAQEAPSQAAPD